MECFRQMLSILGNRQKALSNTSVGRDIVRLLLYTYCWGGRKMAQGENLRREKVKVKVRR
jgi:hypothetical protein